MMYIRLAFLVVLAIAISTALWFRGDAIKARSEAVQLRADLATAKSVNEHNLKAIASLQENLMLANRFASDLADQVEKIDAERDAATDELNALKEANEDVRNYLAQPVPDALRLHYDKTGSVGSNGTGSRPDTGSPPKTVPGGF